MSTCRLQWCRANKYLLIVINFDLSYSVNTRQTDGQYSLWVFFLVEDVKLVKPEMVDCVDKDFLGFCEIFALRVGSLSITVRLLKCLPTCSGNTTVLKKAAHFCSIDCHISVHDVMC